MPNSFAHKITVKFFSGIASGLTSTQIGVVIGWLANIKTRQLQEASEVWNKFKNIFVNTNQDLKLESDLWRMTSMTATTDITESRLPSDIGQQEEQRMQTLMDDYINPFLREYKRNVHAPFREKMREIEGNGFKRWLRTRKFHASLNNFFAVAGTGCAIWGIYSTVGNPGWQKDATNILSVIATVFGALGGAWATGDGIFYLGKLITNDLIKPSSQLKNVQTELTEFSRTGRLNQLSAAYQTGPSELMNQLDVEIGAPTVRLARRINSVAALSSDLGTIFGGLGILSDMIFFGVNTINFVKDIMDKKSKWKQAIDFVNIGVSIAGAATG